MRILIFVVSTLLLAATHVSATEAQCCDTHTSCAKAACCNEHAANVALDSWATELPVIAPGYEWPTDVARPARELAVVFFRDPVRIGQHVLIGKHVIEHDEGRMARGLPCTHIYAAGDWREPVVAFHCRHVDRTASARATVTLQRLPDPSTRIFKLVEFQFEDSTAGHGVPDRR